MARLGIVQCVIATTALFVAAVTVATAAPTVLLEDGFNQEGDAPDPSIWELKERINPEFRGEMALKDGKLVISYADPGERPDKRAGAELLSREPVSLGGGPVVRFTVNIEGYESAAEKLARYFVGFEDLAELDFYPTYGEERRALVVRLRLNGKRVYHTSRWPYDQLLPDGSVIGLELTADRWRVIKKVPGADGFALLSAGTGAPDSEGTVDQGIDLTASVPFYFRTVTGVGESTLTLDDVRVVRDDAMLDLMDSAVVEQEAQPDAEEPPADAPAAPVEKNQTRYPLRDSDWRAEGPGRIDAPADGFQRVAYDSPDGEPVDVYLDNPRKLPADVTRLNVWYASPLGDAAVTFLIRDAEGELREVESGSDSELQGWAIDWNASNRAHWPRWTQLESITLRMPDEDAIRARFPDDREDEVLELVWPRPLSLAGLRIRPLTGAWGGKYFGATGKAARAGRGTIWLTAPGYETIHSFDADFYARIKQRLRWARGEKQVLFVDDLVEGWGPDAYRGTLRYAIRVHDGYQGPLLWRGEGTQTLRGDDMVALWNSRIELPMVSPGRRFIRTKVWNADGALLATRWFEWFVGEGPGDGVSKRTFAMPMRWETGRKDHVFAPGTRQAELRLMIHQDRWTAAGRGAQCRVSIIDWRGETVLEQKLDKALEHVLSVRVAPGNDYFATADLLRADGTRVDAAPLHFGVANGAQSAGRIPSRMPDQDELFKGKAEPHSEYWERSHASPIYPFTLALDMDDFDLWVQQSRLLGSKVLSYRVYWCETEFLPGVYRWDMVDRMIESARRHGELVMPGSGTYGNRFPPFVDALPTRDQYGDFSARGNRPSAWNKEAADAEDRFWTQMIQRYRDDPTVVGWHTMGTIMRANVRGEQRRSGYSAPSREAWKRWLREQGREPYPMPKPALLPGVHPRDLPPDLSAEWRDYVAFAVHTIKTKIEKRLELIRKLDPVRSIQIDRKSMPWAIEAAMPVVAADGNAALKNEGSPRFGDTGLRSMTMQAGAPYLGELHRHQPTSRSLADVVNFWQCHLARHMCWILRWRGHQLAEWAQDNPAELRDDVPQVLQFMQETQSTWDPFLTADFEPPRVLVFGSRAAELHGGWRRGYFDDIDGMRSYGALFRQHQVPAHLATEYADWVNLDDFDLVLACGNVLTEHAVDRLSRYARAGGKLVLVGDVGRYTVTHQENLNRLVRNVGGLSSVRRIEAPQRLDIPGVRDWAAPFAFDDSALAELLDWAGIKRSVAVESDDRPGFEVALRGRRDSDRFYVAAMRTWYGWYRGNIEKEDVLREKFGRGDGRVTVFDLPAGSTWRVEKLHRTYKQLGPMRVDNAGRLTWALDPALAAEVQMYRITRQP